MNYLTQRVNTLIGVLLVLSTAGAACYYIIAAATDHSRLVTQFANSVVARSQAIQ